MSSAEVQLARRVRTAKALEDAHRIADAVIERARKAKAARIPKDPAPGESREERRMERNIRLKVARDVVLARANGACEVCGRTDLRLEVDHLISGGLRRHMESAETMLAECMDCHRARHRNDLGTLRRIKEVCIALGMRDALRAIDARLTKIEAVRRTP